MVAGDGSQAVHIGDDGQASDVSTNQSGALMLSGDVICQSLKPRIHERPKEADICLMRCLMRHYRVCIHAEFSPQQLSVLQTALALVCWV